MTTQTRENLDIVRRQIEAYRRQKDKWMKESPDSPLDEEHRAGFSHLNYYPVDFAYRVPATMARDEQAQPIRIQTSTGDWREYKHYGVIKFVLGGQPMQLNAYQPIGEKMHVGSRELFVPFRDKTSGQETYGAGRYLDLRALDDDTAYVVDFNRAYNPWCPYSTRFSCTLPPRENTLPVAIRAGEMDYSHHAGG